MNNSYVTENPVGLQGGAGGSKNERQIQTVNHIRLINWGTDCFVNSTLQLLSKSDYATFLVSNFSSVAVGLNIENYKLSIAINCIFFDKIDQFQSQIARLTDLRQK